MGMVATIFNSLAFKASLDAIDVDNVVMSALNINQVKVNKNLHKRDKIWNLISI